MAAEKGSKPWQKAERAKEEEEEGSAAVRKKGLFLKMELEMYN